MYKKTNLLMGMFLLVCGTLFPQIYEGDLGFRVFQNDFNVVKSLRNESEIYSGNPHLLKEFTGATIKTVSGKGYKEIPMNYNIYTDRFEFELEGRPYSLTNVENIAFIELDGCKFFNKKYSYNNVQADGYLEQLFFADYTLYKKYRVIYTKPVPTTGYKEAKIADFSRRRPDYFLQIGDSEISHISGFNDIIDLDSDKSSLIESYIKKSKLSFKREEDLVTLIKYLGTI